MPSTPSRSIKREVLLRGVYDEAAKRHDTRIAYALFLELGVTRDEVHAYLGYAISDYFQIYADGVKRAVTATTKRKGAHAA